MLGTDVQSERLCLATNILFVKTYPNRKIANDKKTVLLRDFL